MLTSSLACPDVLSMDGLHQRLGGPLAGIRTVTQGLEGPARRPFGCKRLSVSASTLSLTGLEIPASSVQLKYKIGAGSYGTVFEARPAGGQCQNCSVNKRISRRSIEQLLLDEELEVRQL